MPLPNIKAEAITIVPGIENVILGENFLPQESGRIDTVYSLLVTWKKDKKRKKREKEASVARLNNWLKARLEQDTVIVLSVN